MRFPLTYYHSAPNFSVWQSHPGKKSQILITAGVDGDEFQAINLAKKLMAIYDLSIPITIVPIVNLAGYNNHTSYNPLDRRFPKTVFPGSQFGSSTSRLMYKLSRLVKENEFWIDLHCEATGETLYPFIWAPTTYPVLSHLNARILVESSINKNVPYLMLEHSNIDWVLTIIKYLNRPALPNWQPTYTKIKYEKYHHQKPGKNTLWYSQDIFVSAS